MATEDGRVERDGQGDEGAGVDAARTAPAEPDLLASDLPAPPTYGAAIGAGGETLGPNPELVPLTGGATGRPVTPPRVGARRRPSRSRARSASKGGESRRPRPSLHVPSLGALVATGALVGLLGLAVATVMVLFSFGGNAPAANDDSKVVAMTVPARTILDAAERTAASAKRQARIREAARERQRIQTRHTREVARRRARERGRAPAQSGAVRTTQVVTPPSASTPNRAPAQTVSPAEREFTPGPWNLS